MTTLSPSLPITGTAFECGTFRIFKHTGDENCMDNTYPITVEFTLNDYPPSPNYVLGVHGEDYIVMVNNTAVPISITNGVAHGSVVIPAYQEYVDVYIWALNDNDDDEEFVYLDVTRAYSAQGLNANKFFKVNNTRGEYVVIKDAGWAVKSVLWTEHPTGNELIGTWTGLSVYADKDNPNITNSDYQKVDVVVTVEGLLPQEGGKVDLEVIDPPNASVYGASVGDNWGDNDILHVDDPLWPYTSGTTLTFYNHTMMKTVNAKVSQYAGDNYIITATGGKTIPRTVYSETLTVWRRLWAESAQMYIPSGVNSAGKPLPYQNGDQLADAPILGSHMVSQFERACISAKPFASNTVLVPGVDLFEASPSNFSKLQSYRTSVNQNDYWTVFVIGAFRGEDDDERGFHFDNTILIYNTLIEEEANYYSLSVSFCKELMLLHELGHAFGLDNYEPPFTLYEGIMRSPIDLIDLINNGWTEFANNNIYSDIKDIQQHGNPE